MREAQLEASSRLRSLERDGARLLRNRWFQVGVAIGLGYAVGRWRAPIATRPLIRSLTTTAVAALVRRTFASVLAPARA